MVRPAQRANFASRAAPPPAIQPNLAHLVQPSKDSDSDSSSSDSSSTEESKVMEADRKEYGYFSAMSLLDDTKLTDITVIVGAEDNKKLYTLHRCILSMGSSFLRRVSIENEFKEGQTKTVLLPDIDPQTFDTVLTWLYGGGYQLPYPFDESRLLGIYNAADFLGIPGLRHKLLKAVHSQVRKDKKLSAKEKRVIGNPTAVLQHLCETAHQKDREGLQPISDDLHPFYELNGVWIEETMKSNTNKNYYTCLVIDTLQKKLKGSRN